MGMTIDDTCEPKPMSREEIVDILKTMVFGVQAFERFNAKEREALDKSWNLIDQYENRLKADMVAMLEEIRFQAEEDIENIYEKDEDNILMLAQHNAFADCFAQYDSLLEEKINALKGTEQ